MGAKGKEVSGAEELERKAKYACEGSIFGLSLVFSNLFFRRVVLDKLLYVLGQLFRLASRV